MFVRAGKVPHLRMEPNGIPLAVTAGKITMIVADTLEAAGNARMRYIQSQMQIRSSATKGAELTIQILVRWMEKVNCSAFLRTLALSAEDLMAFYYEKIERDLIKYQDVMLLGKDPYLDGFPEGVLHMLGNSHHAWAGDVYAHWIARNGRHHLVMYLLSLNSSYEALQIQLSGVVKALPVHEEENEAPSDPAIRSINVLQDLYAQCCQGDVLDPTDIPTQYLNISGTICTSGRESIDRKDDHTMLHRTADEGHKGPCQYLVSVHADPQAQDDKTPIDLDITPHHARPFCTSQ